MKIILPVREGGGIDPMILSIWLSVEEPGNKGLPIIISPRMQPKLHMSTPLVYLKRDNHMQTKEKSGLKLYNLFFKPLFFLTPNI